MGQVREEKKRETRQRISDVATALFFERGFDAVTVEEIADAAKVSKMTIFNYFARKEELILDREDDLTLLPLRQALRGRAQGQSAADVLRACVRALTETQPVIYHVDRHTLDWWRIVQASPALKARMRELAEEAAAGLAVELGGPEPDGRARLAGGIVALSVRTAWEEAIRQVASGASAQAADAAFMATIEQGLAALAQLDLSGQADE
ncbi:TetR/AcrR family transcriptional regulator [Massilia sp. 9096]|uniref:TetR/AcrR family transcriptional regulator n=1 Tax=Massilia sp. 9096 TaxID=1500894 RepID=UPI00055B0C7E|nr:TetR/AcrR family transcriptional regulator [Massilia sp. 9096]